MKSGPSQSRLCVVRVRPVWLAVMAVSFALFPSSSRAGTWVVFQNTYTRSAGAPVTVADTFTLRNPATQYTLKAFNGGLQDDTTELVSGCVVLINGVQVIGPGNFNKNVSELDVPVTLLASNTISVQVKGKPGGVLAIEIIGVDNDPPTITASVSPSPNAAGWNNSPVTVTFTCSDKTSGVASCPAPTTVSTEGANQVVSGTATDLAGNTATTSVTINLDMTPPTISGSINPPPDAGGYNSSAVTVTFNCADALSGVASCSPPISVTAEGTFQETGTAVDIAGNTAITTVIVNISFNYFKIRSWQVNPPGDPLQTGKCLDYGATIVLNDCASAHSIRILEIGVTPPCLTATPPCTPPPPRMGSGGTPLYHEVMLFAGNQVIGIANPPPAAFGPSTAPSTTTASVTEYPLELQAPFGTPRGVFFSPAQQIWRLDGDSIILEGSHLELQKTSLLPIVVEVPGPCINTDSNVPCPAPLPQLVLQVQNARGANGSPLVAAVRNLSDNEFWDFIPGPGSQAYPTTGFQPVASEAALWNVICASPKVKTSIFPAFIDDPGQPDDGMPLYKCLTPNPGWGSVILVSSPTDCFAVPGPLPGQTQDIGGCLDLSGYPPLNLQTGVTLRGNRRGTNFGPQLYFSSLEWHNLNSSFNGRSGGCNDDTCMLEVDGDYARVTGLRLRGESRATDKTGVPKTIGVQVDYPGSAASPPAPLFNLATSTQFIATVDHNDGSDWGESPVEGQYIFYYGARDSSGNKSNHCSYRGFIDSAGNNWYQCDVSHQLVPYPGTDPSSGGGVGIANDEGTLANIRIARNFLHHNRRDEGGYGASVRGRSLIEKNTFDWNHHDISSDAEPHNEYRASGNLILSGGYCCYSGLDLFLGRQQDFDMHGTDNATVFVGGLGGYHVEVDGNSFLAGDGHDYVLRGYPVNYPSTTNYTNYHGNVSLRNENDAIHFINGTGIGAVHDYHSYPTEFPINISNSQFADSNPPYADPTVRFGVGDFDGDEDDDLFLTTGAAWYYSPAGAREWRFLSAKTDRIDTLLLGDFDGDGRTDVVGINPSGQLVVSWGGVSDWDILNSNPVPCSSISDMAVGDFDGDGRADIFCADGITWWISYSGNTPFIQAVVEDHTRVANLRFGDFDADGTTDVFGVVNGRFTSPQWQVRYGIKGTRVGLTAWQTLPVSLTTNPASVDGLVVADFDGDGVADVARNDHNDWMISFGGVGGWTHYNVPDTDRCVSPEPTLPLMPGIGYFARNRGVDVLLWDGGNEFCIAAGGNAAGQVGWTTGLQAYSTQDMR